MVFYRPPEPIEPLPIPEPIESEAVERVAYQPEPEPEPEPEEDELADLFSVPEENDNDMRISHLFSLPEEDDLSDLTAVSREDIMGTEDYPGTPPATGEVPMQRMRRVKKVSRRRPYPPPTGLMGIRG